MLYIATGGTIDKRPHFLPGGRFDNDSKDFGDTYLPEVLGKGRVVGPYTVKQLFMIDSLDMTPEHRARISAAAEEAEERRIVVTHGTDTMPETARFLKAQKQLGGKTIVLTGAMLPYSVGEESDAMFNIGTATAFAEVLPPGVYVAMNGQYFDSDAVVKDHAAGIFRSE